MRNRRIAVIVAIIVALADMVIIYDMWLAGIWLSPSILSAAKTTAFILIFVGALIAEMQELRASTRALLFIVVLILGGYQAGVNMVVNFHGAVVPETASAFFVRFGSTEYDVKFWYSVADAVVRTVTVVLMWLVTGLVWRGAATVIRMEEEKPVAEEKAMASWSTDSRGEEHKPPSFVKLSREKALPLVLETLRSNGGINQTEMAEACGVTRNTFNAWLDIWTQEGGPVLRLPGRGKFGLPPEKPEMPF